MYAARSRRVLDCSRKSASSLPAALVQAGFRTGRQLAERYTANRARLGEPLDVIKFVCKEFWMEVFRKQARPAPAPHRQHCRAWKAVAAQVASMLFFQIARVALRLKPQSFQYIIKALCNGVRHLAVWTLSAS